MPLTTRAASCGSRATNEILTIMLCGWSCTSLLPATKPVAIWVLTVRSVPSPTIAGSPARLRFCATRSASAWLPSSASWVPTNAGSARPALWRPPLPPSSAITSTSGGLSSSVATDRYLGGVSSVLSTAAARPMPTAARISQRHSTATRHSSPSDSSLPAVAAP